MRRAKYFQELVGFAVDIGAIGAPWYCDSCKHWVDGCQLDRRWPRRMGGDYSIANVHYLCANCHHKKNALECSLGYDQSVHDDWFNLAYPSPTPQAAFTYLKEVCAA